MTRLTGFLGRRNLIKAIGCAGIGYATTVACGKQVEKAATSTAPEANIMAATNSDSKNADSKNAATRPDTSDMTPDQALELLLEGNKRFVSG